MHSSILLPMLLLALGGGDADRPPAGLPPREGLPTTMAQRADTGERLLVLPLRTEMTRPPLECPMPVQRPVPTAPAPISTIPNRNQPGRGARAVPLQEEEGSRMPIVRSGCWNPLDQPRDDRDSTAPDTVNRR